jgi:hypothetical protein
MLEASRRVPYDVLQHDVIAWWFLPELADAS